MEELEEDEESGEVRVASRRAGLEWTGGNRSNHWMGGEDLVCFNRVCFGCLAGKGRENGREGCAGIECSEGDCQLGNYL